MRKNGREKLVRRCSIWRALEVIGDAQALQILSAACVGVSRFDDLHRTTGLLKTVLSNRLNKLLAAGCMYRRAYSDKPPRYDYLLTEKGQELSGLLIVMLGWDQTWSADHRKPTVHLKHRHCGCTTHPVSACRSCGQEIHHHNTHERQRGAPRLMAAAYTRRRRQKAILPEQADAPILLSDSLETFGDRWAALILRGAFNGLTRFDDLRNDCGISTNILSDRLNRLCDLGLLRRHQYMQPPPRDEFLLTDKGRATFPIMKMLQWWGDRWYADEDGPPADVTHAPCGNALEPVAVCEACRRPLELQDVTFHVNVREDIPEGVAAQRVAS